MSIPKVPGCVQIHGDPCDPDPLNTLYIAHNPLGFGEGFNSTKKKKNPTYF